MLSLGDGKEDSSFIKSNYNIPGLIKTKQLDMSLIAEAGELLSHYPVLSYYFLLTLPHLN